MAQRGFCPSATFGIFSPWGGGRVEDKPGSGSCLAVAFNANDLPAQQGFADKSRQVGVLSQEVQAVLPEAVARPSFDCEHQDYGEVCSKSGEDDVTVPDEKLLPLLIEAIRAVKAAQGMGRPEFSRP